MKKIVYYVNQFYGQNWWRRGGRPDADRKRRKCRTSCCNAGGTERYWRGCRNDRLW